MLFGVQVAAKAALDWIDLVSDDLETAGYTVRAADICAAGLSAPNIRQRFWFGATRGLAHAAGTCVPVGMQDAGIIEQTDKNRSPDLPAGSDCTGGMSHTARRRCRQARHSRPQSSQRSADAGATGGLANANVTRPQGRACLQRPYQQLVGPTGLDRNTPWADPEWVWYRDNKWRPSQPGLYPLAHGISNLVGRLRAYGNAIITQVAAEFIWRKHAKLQTFMEELYYAWAGDGAENFNCVNLARTADDIAALEVLIANNDLPESEGGFFFGH